MSPSATSLSPDEVARKHASRPSFRLVSYQEVALPLWRLNVRCLVLSHKMIPPLQEFALKLVSAGLTEEGQISGFLGIAEQLTTATLAMLINDDYLLPLSEEGDGTPKVMLSLTPKGRRVLREESDVVPEETILPLHYDGLLRLFVTPGSAALYRPRDIRELGLLEIPPFPADPPEAQSVKPVDVQQALAAVTTSQDIPRDILAIQGIEGRKARVLRRAVALVYEALDGMDVEVAFAIDGRLSDVHEAAFAKAEGARKLGIVQSLRRGVMEGIVESVLPPEVLRQMSDLGEVRTLQQATTVFREAVEDAGARLATTDQDAEREAARSQLANARERLEVAEGALEEMAVRPLEVYEHPRLLWAGLREAQQRLLIVSPWIRAAVVNDDFLVLLEDALKRGVKIRIGYGSGVNENVFERDRRAEGLIKDLAAEYESLLFVDLGDTHAKVLVVDSRFVVVTSFNWLSFQGDPNRPFRDERGLLVTLPETIEDIFSSFERRLMDASS